MKRIERIRLYPTRHQLARLVFMLDVTRQLYNALLEQRRDAYRKCGACLSGTQSKEITALRRDDARIASVFRECEDAVLHRLELAYRAFFRRVTRGQTPGFPRFKSFRRWEQLEFPHGDRALMFDAKQCRVRIPGLGWVKNRKGRTVPSTFRRAWVVRKNGRWYACFECDRTVRASADRQCGAMGVDRGVHVLAATSDGRLFANPRPLGRFLGKLARCQRAVTRKKRNGKNRRKAVGVLARLHEKIARIRRDALHKVSRRIVDVAPNVIGLENLRVASMTRSAKGTLDLPGRNVRAKSGLNRVILDAGFGLLRQMIESKAEEAGITVVGVDPKYSSQKCSRCGHVAAESRQRRRFACVACEFSVHADVNAALEIRRRAQLVPAGRGVVLANLSDP
jgi:putative transposase